MVIMVITYRGVAAIIFVMDIHSPDLIQALKLKGILEKRSRQFLVGWQKRFWAVVGVDLLYYTDQSLADLKGKMPISKITDISTEDSKVFTFVCEERKYELKAANQQVRDQWIRGLKTIRKYTGDTIRDEPSSPKSGTSVKSSKSISSFKDVAEKFQNKEENWVQIQQPIERCKTINDLLQCLGLVKMASLSHSKRISSRVAFLEYKKGYTFVLSCKSLTQEFEDEEILEQKLVEPFHFHTLYKVKFGRNKVKDICRASEILSIQEGDKFLKINCGKRMELELTVSSKEFVRKLKKAVEIGKEYHNSKNICLKTNIDPLIKIYEAATLSESKCKVKIYLEGKYADFLKTNPKAYSDLKAFSTFFGSLRRFGRDYVNAIEVSSGKKGALLQDFLEFIHRKVHIVLSQFWTSKHQDLQPGEVIELASLTDRYRQEAAVYVKDQGLELGVGVLVKTYLKHSRTKLTNLLTTPRANEPTNCSLSQEVFDCLEQEACVIMDKCHSLQALRELIFFTEDFYKIWVEDMYLTTFKMGDPERLALKLGEINTFKEDVFVKLKNKVLNRGLDALSFEDCFSETSVISIHNNLYSSVLQSLLKLLFTNINKSVLKQNLMELDLKTLVEEVSNKLKSLKQISSEDLQSIKKEVMAELVQYELTLISTLSADSKNKTDAVIKKINVDRAILEKELLQVYDAHVCDREMGVFLDVIEFLSSDSVISTRKYFKVLKHKHPQIFSLGSAKSMIDLKTQLNKEEKANLYNVCVDAFNQDEREHTEADIFLKVDKESILESYAMSSRRSTLTFSIEKRASFRPRQESEPQKRTISGYLKKKKVENRSIKRMYERRYFTILEGYLLWYSNETSSDLHNKIDLKDIKMISCSEDKKDVFFLHLHDCVYKFKADTPDSCQEWMSVLKTYITSNCVESPIVVIEDSTPIFREFEREAVRVSKVRMQSTRESILSKISEVSRSKYSPSPEKSASKISALEPKERLLKKESLNIELKSAEAKGCWLMFKNCVKLQ